MGPDKKPLNIIFIAFLAILFAFFFFNEAQCDEFKLITSVALKEEYNDNIFFTEENEEDDFIFTVSPKLRLIEKTERFYIDLYGRIDSISYSDNNDLDAVDQDYSGRVNYQLTEKTGIFTEAGYRKDSRIDRDIEVDETGEATGLLQSNSPRFRKHLAFSANNTLTEKTAVSFSYSFLRDDFDDIEENDMRVHTANLGLTHQFGFFIKPTVGRINLGYAGYDYLDSENISRTSFGVYQHLYQNSKVDSYSLTLGASRELNEAFSILFDIGARYTLTEYENRFEYDSPFIPPLTENEKNRETGGVAGATLTYNGRLTDWYLDLSYDLKEASGRSSPTKRTAIVIDIKRKFTYELLGNLTAGYYINKWGEEEGAFSSRRIDERTLRIHSKLRYDFSTDIALEASYIFTKLRNEEDNTDTKRNLFFVRLIFKYPLFE